jgi:hypothetical protein
MALQALRRAAAAAASKQRGTFRYLQQRQQQGLAVPTARMASAPDARAPLWALASRMVSTAREREADSGLLHVLRSELDHERKTYDQPKVWIQFIYLLQLKSDNFCIRKLSILYTMS